jgi:acyl carrier protein
MTREEIKSVVLSVLGKIAPEVDPAEIRPEVGFREQLDLDSMDFLNFVVALHEAFHVEIPETDYPKLATLKGAVDFLVSRQA